MIRSEFQPSRKRMRWQRAGFFVSIALLVVSARAFADGAAARPARAAFPAIASYTPTATAGFAPTPSYNPPPPNTPAPAGAPYDPSWGVPEPTPAPAPARQAAAAGADAHADRGAESAEEAAEAAKAWMLSLEGYTSVPVDIGGRVTFETPFRLRLSAAYGFVPGAYFGVVNNVVERSGAYDAFGADVVAARLDDGRVLRAMIGFRPVAGLYLDAGYARVGLSGGLIADQYGYSIDTTIHMWTAEIGYQGAVADRLVLALGVGVMKAFAASSSATADFELGRSKSALAVTEAAVAEYDRKLERYGYVPTVTARIGWDVF